MENPNYYAIIPAEVRYDKELKEGEKLLYGEISALANKQGYCNASNRYFADLYGKHKDTVSAWISNLKKKNYVEIELIKENDRVVERRIYLTPIGKNAEGYRQKCLGGIGKNAEENNTSNNNKKEEEEIIEFYENNIALITQFVAEEIAMFLEDGLSKDLIITAMQEAVSRNKRNWKYVSAILEDCLNKKIFTKEAYEISQKEFRQEKEKKPKKKQETIPYQNDFSEYDQYAQKEKKR